MSIDKPRFLCYIVVIKEVRNMKDAFDLNIKFVDRADVERDHYNIFSLVREMFADMVAKNDFTLIDHIFDKRNIDQSLFTSPNLEDYLIEDEEGQVVIAEKRYKCPNYLFDIIHILTNRVLFAQIKETYVKDYYVPSKNKEDEKNAFSGFKLNYIKKMRTERSMHEDITKVVQNPFRGPLANSRFEERSLIKPFDNAQEYITSTISTAILVVCLDFLRTTTITSEYKLN